MQIQVLAAHVAYTKHNTEDVSTAPKKARGHKSLVLTLLSAPAKFIHASIRTPVRMPLNPRPEMRSRHQAHPFVAHDALHSHTPTGTQQ